MLCQAREGQGVLFSGDHLYLNPLPSPINPKPLFINPTTPDDPSEGKPIPPWPSLLGGWVEEKIRTEVRTIAKVISLWFKSLHPQGNYIKPGIGIAKPSPANQSSSSAISSGHYKCHSTPTPPISQLHIGYHLFQTCSKVNTK